MATAHVFKIDMNDPNSSFLIDAVSAAYKNPGFHGKVKVTVDTDTGVWETRVESPSMITLVNFVAHMNHAIPTEGFSPAPVQAQAPATGWVVEEESAPSAPFGVTSPNPSPSPSPAPDLTPEVQEDEPEMEEDEEEEIEDEESEEAEKVVDKTDRPSEPKRLKVPTLKPGNVTKTAHSAVTIQG